MKVKTLFAAFLVCLIVLSGCGTSKVEKEQNPIKITLPEDIPDYVKEKDFEKIDWDRVAAEFDTGERSDMVGNKNKLGIIGPELKPGEVEKWMWHLWGVDEAELTIVGFNNETKIVHPILLDGAPDNWSWTGSTMGAVNGADAHMPSNVKVPESGKWAYLVYIDNKLFDILVMDIKDK